MHRPNRPEIDRLKIQPIENGYIDARGRQQPLIRFSQDVLLNVCTAIGGPASALSWSLVPHVAGNDFVDKGAVPHKPDLGLVWMVRRQSTGVNADEFA